MEKLKFNKLYNQIFHAPLFHSSRKIYLPLNIHMNVSLYFAVQIFPLTFLAHIFLFKLSCTDVPAQFVPFNITAKKNQIESGPGKDH